MGPSHAVAGFARVYITEGSLLDSVAISASLFCIVMSSVLTGTALPFGLAMMGVDPANAGTSIQVMLRLHILFSYKAAITPSSLVYGREENT